MKPQDLRPVVDVLGIHVDAIDMPMAMERVHQMLASGAKSYICAVGVHGVMEAQRSPELAGVYAGAEMTIPDGMPLVWVGHRQGHAAMQRVTGPDFMAEVFRRRDFAGVTHYLYGGEPGVAEQLRTVLTHRFPGARIVGASAPPFREFSDEEEREFVAEVQRLKPDILWMGISCPKQELFMARYLPLLETKVMVGVGAAFDYHTGRIHDSAEWVKRAGLQWFHRLLQDPKRLWKRYLRNNPAFVYRVALQMLSTRGAALGATPPMPRIVQRPADAPRKINLTNPGVPGL